MQERLKAVGLRPINNIVDVTNYVMLECGQPLHAFDLARLRGRRICVRAARPGERMATLDGAERALPAGALLGAAEIGLLATVGATTIQVYPRPRVAVLSSGDGGEYGIGSAGGGSGGSRCRIVSSGNNMLVMEG